MAVGRVPRPENCIFKVFYMFEMRQNILRTICSSCYLACASGGPHNHHKWNTDMYLMMTTEIISLRNRGFAIIALGDFNSKVGQIPGLEGNTPNHNANTPLFNIFISSLHLTILNTLPISQGLFTHFVEKDGVPLRMYERKVSEKKVT